MAAAATQTTPTTPSPSHTRTGGRHGRVSGRGGRGGRGSAETLKPKNTEEAVPILRYGPHNNWLQFKEAMAFAVGEKYGYLGRIIDDEEY